MPRFIIRNLIVLAALLAVLPISSCRKEGATDNIPNVAVEIYIPLSLPEYTALNSIGNYVLVNGGYRGIIVFRKSLTEFAAYERACPFDPTAAGSLVEPDSGNVSGVDRKCGSEFLFFDGSVLNGPATRPLKQYRCDFDGNSPGSLHIYN
ncbi:MAG: hypothetical protein RL021_1131 [Bacteroidota bacterium]|jgi:nitrite reductase/ring-hydroxylating ferredoxin subunit